MSQFLNGHDLGCQKKKKYFLRSEDHKTDCPVSLIGKSVFPNGKFVRHILELLSLNAHVLLTVTKQLVIFTLFYFFPFEQT